MVRDRYKLLFTNIKRRTGFRLVPITEIGDPEWATLNGVITATRVISAVDELLVIISGDMVKTMADVYGRFVCNRHQPRQTVEDPERRDVLDK